MNRLGGFVVPLLALYLIGQRGLGVAAAGAVVSLFGAGQAVAGMVGGALADRVGRRPTMLLSLWGGAAVMLSLAYVRSIPAIAGATLALGFVGELYRPAVAALVTDVVPEQDRVRAFGLLYWVVNLGFAIAPVLGGVIAERSYVALFVADAATMAIYGVVVAWWVPETRPASPPVRDGAPPVRDGAPPTSVASMLGDRVFVAFLVASFLASFVTWQSHVSLSAHMTAQGHSEAIYGAVVAVNGALIVLVQPPLTRWLGRRDAELVLIAAVVVSGAGFALHGFVAAIPLHVAAVVVWTLGEIAWMPTSAAVVAGLAPADARGRYQGAFTSTWGLAACTGPLLGAQVLEAQGAGVLFGGCLVLGVGTAVLLGLTATARRRRTG